MLLSISDSDFSNIKKMSENKMSGFLRFEKNCYIAKSTISSIKMFYQPLNVFGIRIRTTNGDSFEETYLSDAECMIRFDEVLRELDIKFKFKAFVE